MKKCTNDEEYLFEFNNNCLKICPNDTFIKIDENLCLIACGQRQYLYQNMCYSSLPNDLNTFFQNGYIYINNDSDINYILNEIILSAYPPEEGSNLFIQT